MKPQWLDQVRPIIDRRMGARIRAIRRRRNIRQKDFALALGFPQATISRIERGIHSPKIRASTLIEALSTTPEELFGSGRAA